MVATLDDLSYCPALHELLRSRQIQLPSGDYCPVRATSTLNNLATIRHFILTEKPHITLEVGLAFGASALTFLSTLKEVHGSGFHHTAIDPFQSTVWKSAAVHTITSAGLSDNFTHIEEDSAITLPRLCSQGRSFGLIYVDGSHIFEDVFIDFFYAARLLAGNGLALFDDCTDRHVRKVIRFIDRNYSGILRREDVPHAVGNTVKRRVARALGKQQLVAYRKVGDTPREWNVPFSDF